MTTVGPVQVLPVQVRLVLVPPVLAGEEVPAVLPVPVVPLALMVLPVLLVPLVSLVLMVVLMMLPLVRAMALPGREMARLPVTRTALVSTAMVWPKAVLLKALPSQVLAPQVLASQVRPVNRRALVLVHVTRDRPERMPHRPMGQVRVARGARKPGQVRWLVARAGMAGCAGMALGGPLRRTGREVQVPAVGPWLPMIGRPQGRLPRMTGDASGSGLPRTGVCQPAGAGMQSLPMQTGISLTTRP